MWNNIFTAALLAAAYSPTINAIPSPARNIIRADASLPVNVTNPLEDPFYLVPSDVSTFPPGHILKHRQILTSITGASVKSYQVQYRTTNQVDGATATVATIWVPAVPAYPTKIFSYQEAEDSLSLACSQSYSFANSSAPLASNADQDGYLITWALSQGYYAVTADFDGPNSAFLCGLLEGRSVLDAIRATANYVGCEPGFEVGLVGYSGGAHATVWASSQAASYAPELNIVAAAYGGTPVSVIDTYNYLNTYQSAVLGAGAFIGNARGIPKVNDTLYPLLTPDGKKLWENLQAPEYCILANTSAYPGLNFTAQFTKDIFSIPYVQQSTAEQSLLSNQSPLPIPVPTFPRLEWHGLNDSQIPVEPEVEYVKQQCARGADIRLGLFPKLNHVPNMLNGIPGAILFLKQAFDKTLVKGECGSNTTWPDIGSKLAIELLGEDTNFALATLLAKAIEDSPGRAP